jgi:hypothetical protein
MITLDGTNGITTPDVDTDGLTVDTNTLFVDTVNGRIGSGTTSPAEQLHLATGTNAGYATIRTESSDLPARLRMGFGASGAGDFSQISTSNFGGNLLLSANESNTKGGSFMAFRVDAAERARIDASGNLLVGTTGLANNGKLTVNGLVRFFGTGDGGAFLIDKSTSTTTTAQEFLYFTVNNQTVGSGQINANGASQAAFGTFSDRRLKENIQDLPSQLDNIMALRPVEFDYLESEGGGHQIGFIAQEMQEVYPDAVGERTRNGMLTVTGWSKTEARLVKALQEALTKIEALEARVAALETNA